MARMLARKPRAVAMIAMIALAKRMVRGVWAILTNQENYRNPVAAV